MANLTIFGLVQLTSAGADLSADLVPVWDNSALETKKMTLSDLRTLMSPVNWSDSFSSATQATSSWTPNNAATNINAAIRPKGTGAIVASIPDGTTVGGNSRGQYAVDLQITRSSSADRVAGGSYSFIGGGTNNGLGIAPYSVIVGGQSNRINDATGGQSQHAFIGGGSSNYIDRSGPSVICGGSSNTIGRPSSFIGGGGPNTISGFLSVIVGGTSNSVGNVDYASVVGGVSNTASANYAIVGGGQTNTASATHTTVGGGNGNTAGSSYDVVCGGQSNATGGSNNSTWKFIGGGSNNTVSGDQTNYSGVACGNLNAITNGRHAFIGGGSSNTINSGGWNCTIGGGQSNYANGNGQAATHATIGGGFTNTTSAYGAIVTGGSNGIASLYCQQVHASGQFSAQGDAQAHELIWRRAITGTAQTELFLDGASIAAVLPGTNSVWNGIIDITSICTTTGDGTTVVGHVSATAYKVTIKRIGTTTSLVGGVQEIGITNADASMATAVFTIDNNDTNESLRIRFTPPSTAGSTTVIRAVATFRGTQIKY
jgi:hypothetical protein